jgi:hypothetical protein
MANVTYRRVGSAGEQSFDGYVSTAREKLAVISAGPTQLFELEVQLQASASAKWLLLFDATAAPGAGTFPRVPPVPVVPGQLVPRGFPDGLLFKNGVVACLSDAETYASPATNDGFFRSRHLRL